MPILLAFAAPIALTVIETGFQILGFTVIAWGVTTFTIAWLVT